MPNYVTNRITFDQAHTELVQKYVTDGVLDFNKLVPEPLQMYRGHLSFEDEKDFPCNWMSWRLENWQTKWPATSGRMEPGCVVFDTAWAVPQPIVVALANATGIGFVLEYFDEGHNFWGVEGWDAGMRRMKRHCDPADYARLCEELKGYTPGEDEE